MGAEKIGGIAAADDAEADDAARVKTGVGEGAGAGNPRLQLLEDPKVFNVRFGREFIDEALIPSLTPSHSVPPPFADWAAIESDACSLQCLAYSKVHF
jgi:hypothetical protein